mmetsp:Transcript_37816/g.68910  ORF Transcript_37816/g.68910 Transcript_37816/m.68910 type:complete len:192 (+) Transcript_37816:66-641(+)
MGIGVVCQTNTGCCEQVAFVDPAWGCSDNRCRGSAEPVSRQDVEVDPPLPPIFAAETACEGGSSTYYVDFQGSQGKQTVQQTVNRTKSLNGHRPRDAFLVALDRSAGRSLGVEVDKVDGKTLLITDVSKEGLIPDWNAAVGANSPNRIKKGDSIIEVNGVHGDASQIAQECRKNQLLRMWVLLRWSPCAKV